MTLSAAEVTSYVTKTNLIPPLSKRCLASAQVRLYSGGPSLRVTHGPGPHAGAGRDP